PSVAGSTPGSCATPTPSCSTSLPTLPEEEPLGEQALPCLPTGTFRCACDGCNAIPCPTQCMLSRCSRGVGGQGFKRRNELIRHGLVHNSPGYICPFCANHQYKYPRPDNLLRHVRAHHKDRDQNDPALRDVLNQTTGRPRRRRPTRIPG
ncbi:uncharacterized protein A1O9_13089, partial [Exophiala aquamarina CBS 119918]